MLPFYAHPIVVLHFILIVTCVVQEDPCSDLFCLTLTLTLQEILVHFICSFKNHVFWPPSSAPKFPQLFLGAGTRAQVKLFSRMAKNITGTLPFSKLEVNDQERQSQNKAENTNSDVCNAKEWVLTTYPWGATQNHSFLTIKWSHWKIWAHWG